MPDLAWIAAAALCGLAMGVPTTILAGLTRRPRRAFGPPIVVVASIASAALWGFVAAWFDSPVELAAYAGFATAAVALALVDIADHRLPNVIVVPTLAVVAVLLTIASWPDPLGVIVGGGAMFAVYLVIALASRHDMGMGDVKLAAAVGVATGYLGTTAWVVALATAFFIGGVVSLAGLASRRLGARSRIPFGPFMLLGGFVAILLS